jgi:hypothetical protein
MLAVFGIFISHNIVCSDVREQQLTSYMEPKRKMTPPENWKVVTIVLVLFSSRFQQICKILS